MPTRKRRGWRRAPRTGTRLPIRATAFVLATTVAVIAIIAVFLVRGQRSTDQAGWARLGSQDVHSLAFVGDDPNRLLFGHHGGLSESLDGGRTWRPLPTRADAMAMQPARDGSIVIAGHDVFIASHDRGQTWAPLSADLPSLDIHGFTRDPGDPARMWAYLATGGLWESNDSGARWLQVRQDNVVFPLAVRRQEGTRLLGVDASGLVASDDGGRTWASLVTPPAYPMTGLAATDNGGVLYAGALDGLFRSADGGRTWTKTNYVGSALAIATLADGATVAVVSRDTEFFRSPDGGRTWPGPG
jgi:photosystem II stability/assembly factor-like uncharacterized protein